MYENSKANSTERKIWDTSGRAIDYVTSNLNFSRVRADM